METQIFYYTGMILWGCLCALVISLGISLGVIIPIKTIHWVSTKLWKWKLLAEIAHTGFNREDIEYAIRVKLPNGVSVDDMLRWVKEVKERGESIKKMER